MRAAAAASLVFALLAVGAVPRPASAGATVDLFFVGSNGAPIEPTSSVSVVGGSGPGIHAGDTLTMAVRLTTDEPLTIAVFSLNYDLGSADHLDVASAFQWHGVPLNKLGNVFFAPIKSSAFDHTSTFVGSFQGHVTDFGRTLPASGGAHSGGYQMGTVTWHVNGGNHGASAEILSGLLNFGVDFFADGDWNDMESRVLFNAATVNFVPEPSSAALLGVALLGLAVVRRYSR